MRYALADNSVPPPPPKDHLRPPTLTRPHSDSDAFPSSGHLQPATPQRPHLQQAPHSAPAKPALSGPDTSRLSPAQTPTKRPRASSTPPSPTASTSSSSTKGEQKVQCSGTTKLDKRCTRMVTITAPLSRLNGEDLPHYCHQHINTAFDDVKFPSHKDAGVWIDFNDWIPEYLQKETQDQLRKEMRTKHSVADVPGYIYAFEIDDTTRSDIVHIKVGRAVKLTKRLAEWDKQCQSKQTHLRGFWPTTKDADDGNLGRGRVQVGEPAPWCHKLERLIHLELADLAVNAPYLDPAYPNVKGSTGSSNDRSVTRSPCPDCTKVHQEIFSFRRADGRYKGKEWEEIVKPVIEKWGGFVEAYV
ncbi:hypothetical protein K466DRAFT_488222 [Polyporus arcularius HHB13444]|uniref:DUF1766-domain-containing protein n=1 Tax=Polyporus arcularius HHB13444 TaxID=1314778 RepID=A0A5C3PHM7_9APHY|nr:hypothetical protein K466DRAFT_488222 [Polyporus arcularius HHB13444]